MSHCGLGWNKVHKQEVHPLDIAILILYSLFQVVTNPFVFKIQVSLSMRNFFPAIFILY